MEPERALSSTRLLSRAGVSFGFSAKRRAATPATWGAAIEVPLELREDVSSECLEEAALIDVPAAKMCVQAPQFELVLATLFDWAFPTLRTPWERAGETSHELALSFPAATTTRATWPAAAVALSTVREPERKRREAFMMEVLPLRRVRAAAQSMPAMYPEELPRLSSPSTRTSMRLARLATPHL